MLIAQISDLHICRNGDLYEDLVPSNRMAEAAVEAVNALASPPDCVTVTGDLTDHGLAEEYANRQSGAGQARLSLFRNPRQPRRPRAHACSLRRSHLPSGDRPTSLLHQRLARPHRLARLDRSRKAPRRQSTFAGLDWLDATLAEAPDHPTVLLTHHHPFTSGIFFLDEYRHFGAPGLARVLARHSQVERVLCGHVHRHMTSVLGGRPVMTCPSTRLPNCPPPRSRGAARLLYGTARRPPPREARGRRPDGHPPLSPRRPWRAASLLLIGRMDMKRPACGPRQRA